MNQYLKLFLNILYPRHCPVCHRILKDQKKNICPECENIFIRADKDYCLKCGKPVKEEEEYCDECRAGKRIFDRNISVFVYNERMRQSLVRYKYYGYREYGDYFSACICRYAAQNICNWKPDVIVPVPLTARKQRQRGFNQAGYLADRVGQYFGIPVSHSLLKKIHKTKSQKKLSASQRRQNLKDAYRTGEDLHGITVLVIDDVYTTGSTMEAAASCLKEAGAEKVYGITLCTGHG